MLFEQMILPLLHGRHAGEGPLADSRCEVRKFQKLAE